MYSPLEKTLIEEYRKSPRFLRRQAWGEFLSRYEWEWFVTLTFVIDVHPEEALKKFRVWVSMINRLLYGPRWAKKAHGGVYWVCSIEYQKRGVIHFHALMIGVRELRRLDWMDAWHNLDEKTGFARIEVPRNNVATSSYVSKYLAKDGEVFFSDNLKDVTGGLFRQLGEALSTRY